MRWSLKQPLLPATAPVDASHITCRLQKWGRTLGSAMILATLVTVLLRTWGTTVPAALDAPDAATPVTDQWTSRIHISSARGQGSRAGAQSAPRLHPFNQLKHIYALPARDTSPRCQQSKICDGNYTCSADDPLACVTSAADRQRHIKHAIKWSWEGYRKHAWGRDELDALSQKPLVWFNLGLTIVDSLDTLLIAGLEEEFQQARHWVANRLEFHDGSTVQTFEVNIRILGGLLSAYFLSKDEVFLLKANALADRLMVAFNTTSGLPARLVPLSDAAGRLKSSKADAKSNLAEAGTISMEFTTIGRLLGRADMFDAGNQFWYVLMGNRNFSGLYCTGINMRGKCHEPKLTLGSSADSSYEYMLKQWLLSGKTQEVPLQLYKEAAAGIRTHLVRHVSDGSETMSFISEATANKVTGAIGDTNNRFEHLTCFAGGMFVLGKLNGIATNLTPADMDDVTLGARIGRACYELYHQAPSGLAPDSVHYSLRAGGNLPPSSQERAQAAAAVAAAAAAAAAAKAKAAPAVSRRGRAGRTLLALLGGSNTIANATQQVSPAANATQHANTLQAAPAEQPRQPLHADVNSTSVPQRKKHNLHRTATSGSRNGSRRHEPEQLPHHHHHHTANQTAAGSNRSTAAHGRRAWRRRHSGRAAGGLHSSSSGNGSRRLLAAARPAGGSASPSPAAVAAAAPVLSGPPVVTWSQKSKADFLRPEAVETLFYLWRATGDEIYREWGWSMFRAFEKWCRLDSGGYATVADVNTVPPKLAHKMESFWVAETLKYFFLLFEDDPSVLPLDEWVFNTEAHPLPVWGSAADRLALKQAKMRRQAAELDREQSAAQEAAAAAAAASHRRAPQQHAKATVR